MLISVNPSYRSYELNAKNPFLMMGGEICIWGQSISVTHRGEPPDVFYMYKAYQTEENP